MLSAVRGINAGVGRDAHIPPVSDEVVLMRRMHIKCARVIGGEQTTKLNLVCFFV